MAIITISRGTASGGRDLAARLAHRLGYPCLGREVLLAAARELGAPADELQKRLVLGPQAWTRTWRERDAYILALRMVLTEVSQEGKLVYHGLAGQWLLQGVPGVPSVLRVRVVAPLETRIGAVLRKRPDMSAEEAAEFIRTADAERRQWVRRIYGADLEDPAQYDLTVNLRTTTVDTACSAIAAAVAQPQYEVTPQMRADLAALASSCRRQLCAARSER